MISHKRTFIDNLNFLFKWVHVSTMGPVFDLCYSLQSRKYLTIILSTDIWSESKIS